MVSLQQALASGQTKLEVRLTMNVMILHPVDEHRSLGDSYGSSSEGSSQ